MDHATVSFEVPQDDLASALAWVARSLPAKPTQPILRGVLIEATEEGLELSGFDREVSTRIHINADVRETGSVLVAGKLASDIIGSLPNRKIQVEHRGSTVFVKAGSSKFELPAMTIEDYPPLPDLPEITGTIDAQLFGQAISQVAVAAGKDDTLPMLTGIRMEIHDDRVVLAATDRFRLAVRELHWNPTASQSAELLIPARSLADTARSMDAHGTDPVEIRLGTGEAIATEGLMGIATDGRHTTTRLLDADFPKFRPLLPKIHNTVAVVEIAPLLDAIRRVSLLADRNSQIRMEFEEGSVTLSAGGSDSGSAQESLPCELAGEPLRTAFNPVYLKEGLNAVRGERVMFGFTQPSRPAILIAEPKELPQFEDDGTARTPQTDFTYLLMPVRLPG